MKCPKCIKLGMKSKIYGGGCGMTTLAYYAPWHDEEGVYHNHDNNTTTMEYTCSNNHSWTEKTTGQCPNCEWGHDDKPDITIHDDIIPPKLIEQFSGGDFTSGDELTLDAGDHSIHIGEDAIRSTNRMFATCGKCGKQSNWVLEFAQTSEDFWFQPEMTCPECYKPK